MGVVGVNAIKVHCTFFLFFPELLPGLESMLRALLPRLYSYGELKLSETVRQKINLSLASLVSVR